MRLIPCIATALCLSYLGACGNLTSAEPSTTSSTTQKPTQGPTLTHTLAQLRAAMPNPSQLPGHATLNHLCPGQDSTCTGRSDASAMFTVRLDEPTLGHSPADRREAQARAGWPEMGHVVLLDATPLGNSAEAQAKLAKFRAIASKSLGRFDIAPQGNVAGERGQGTLKPVTVSGHEAYELVQRRRITFSSHPEAPELLQVRVGVVDANAEVEATVDLWAYKRDPAKVSAVARQLLSDYLARLAQAHQ